METLKKHFGYLILLGMMIFGMSLSAYTKDHSYMWAAIGVGVVEIFFTWLLHAIDD